MVEARSIEALSVCFTAGAFAGTVVAGGAACTVSAAALVLAAVPVLLGKWLLSLKEPVSTGIILGSFLLLGFFSALSSAITTYPEADSFRDGLPLRAVEALRALIGSIPFPRAETAPLLTALLTGDRSGLAGETVAAFRGSGASHILALSGLHMGVLYLIVGKLLSLAGNTPAVRAVRSLVCIGAAAFFTLMTGASPSLVRAFLFILINEVAALTGRRRKPSRVLCLALLVQVVLDPGVLHSLGFQLSYLAMGGILLVYPAMEKWYPDSGKWDPLRRIWKAAALSISCQLTTAPLVWLRFHTFPKYFLLTNLLALPLTSAIMGTAVLTLILWALGCCPGLLISATDGLCTLLQRVLEIIASL